MSKQSLALKATPVGELTKFLGSRSVINVTSVLAIIYGKLVDLVSIIS